jgi:uncharacterized membrane protein
MKTIHLDTEVQCTDGRAGKSTCVIVDPSSLRITHFVVAERRRPHTERMVPIEHVVDVDPDSIKVALTTDTLAEMKPFVRTTFRQVEIPRYAGAGLAPTAYAERSALEVEVEQVPAGEVAIHEGDEVEDADGGAVGHVTELRADPRHGQITHIVLREGRLWGRKDVLIPVSAVETVYKGRIRLSLDQESLAEMLAIPAVWRADDTELELVTSAFAGEEGARGALKAVKRLAEQSEFEIVNTAVLVRDAEGKISLQETGDLDSTRGTLIGAISGSLIGLAGGPVGALIGAAAGAVTGHAAARWVDLGFSDEYLQNLAGQLQPGTSTLVTLVDADQADWLAAALAGLDGEVIRQALDGTMIDQLTDNQGGDRRASGANA